MIKGEHDKLKDLASRNVCAEHKTPLVVAWHSGEKCWTLRCDEGNHVERQYLDAVKMQARDVNIRGHYPDSVTRQLSLTEEFKIGSALPSPIADNVKKRMRRKVMSGVDKQVKEEFALVPHVDLGTGELLSDGLIHSLVEYAQKYALDPYRSHVVLMYGKPYITIDGYLYHAQRSGKPYSLQSRPLTTPELKQYKIGATDHAWVAEVNFTETGSTFTGIGIVTYEEMTAKSPRDETKLRSPVVAAHPWQLAQKRAEWQALRRAFPIGETKEEVKNESTTDN